MTSASSTAIMANHVQMAVLTLKKEIAIESKKMAGVVNPRIKKNRIVAGSWGSSSSLSFLVEYQWIAVKSSLPTARVAA